MALNYTNLFEDLGEFTEHANTLLAFAKTTLPAYETEILDELQGNGMDDLAGQIPPTFESWQGQVTQWVRQLGTFAQTRLTDLLTIVTELGITSASLNSVLPELYRQMVDDSQTVDASTVAAAAVSSTGILGDSDGMLLVTTVLDGYSSPIRGGQACDYYAWDLGNAVGSGRLPGEHADYAGTNSELSKGETIYVTCTSDNATANYDGREQFTINGAIDYGEWDVRGEGSGNGPSIQPLNAISLLNNGEFETFSSNTPSNWTIDAGTAGTHVLANSSPKRGTYCLQLVGDGALAAITLSQSISQASFAPLRRYCCAFWWKGDATAAGTEALSVKMAGTGYTPGTTEQFTKNQAAIAAATAWEIGYFFFNAPPLIPSDFEVQISYSGTPASGIDVYFDGMAFGPVTYHNGVGMVLLAGADPFIVGDQFSCAITNDAAGTFQEYFRRQFKFQLPSDSSGSETIDDALAT